MMRAKPSSAMQKTYDDCFLVVSTAVYFENQNNEAEALRSWKNALDQIYYHNAYRVAPNYTPKSETEKALQESLRQMELQCKERVDLLEALRDSRKEAAEKGESAIAQSIKNIELEEVPTITTTKAPPLPQRPPPVPAKSSRTPSPEKRNMLKTLRPGGKERTPSSSNLSKTTSATSSTVPASNAASQAWKSQNSTFRLDSNPTNKATTPSPKIKQKSAERSRRSEPIVPSYRKEYNHTANQINTDEAIRIARRRRGAPGSSGKYPRHADSSPSPPSEGSALPNTHRIRRKPAPSTNKQPVLADSSAAEPSDVSETSDGPILDPEERIWKEKVDRLMHKLPKGVDETAARQIFNDIVVHGDEVHWTDVAGLDVAKAALKENVVYPFLRPDLFMGLREPARGMLLFGPPGTGKTMLARAVATESKSTFFAISASSLTSKYLGESEKLVRALFALAKALAPSIIFVDEIDSLLSARGDAGEHEATRRIKTEFLIQWSDLARAAAGREQTDKEKAQGDASRVLVLAATNLPWAIDEAARRRFVRRQYIPLPEDHVRASQFRTLLSHQKHSLTESDIATLARLSDGFSGSDITALAKDAAMGPLRSLGEKLLHMSMDEIRPMCLKDFLMSLKTIRPSVSREGLKQYEDWAREFGERGG